MHDCLNGVVLRAHPIMKSVSVWKSSKILSMGKDNDKSPFVHCSEQFHLLTADQVDPELTIGQQEEYLFRPHEEALVLEKLKMGAIQRRIKEGIIEGIGKRKLVEVSCAQGSTHRAIHSVDATTWDLPDV
ncbi:hypothetical protein QJS10_CPB11g00919 [Acorus calamus]|uniref:Uncharacterized protein n=1 Tax=Acorus calamus TaxID=4465 RepID=A0AAV9DWB7_ACOCL|nr:hypothetical protein QJS10_CPB11g00919 [Acorus calamus]